MWRAMWRAMMDRRAIRRDRAARGHARVDIRIRDGRLIDWAFIEGNQVGILDRESLPCEAAPQGVASSRAALPVPPWPQRHGVAASVFPGARRRRFRDSPRALR